MPDRLTLSGDGVTVVTSGVLNDRFDKTLDPVEYRKGIIDNERGIPGEGRRVFRYIVTGSNGANVKLKYDTEKAHDIETSVELKEQVIEKKAEAKK